jgi:hypothetical protein
MAAARKGSQVTSLRTWRGDQAAPWRPTTSHHTGVTAVPSQASSGIASTKASSRQTRRASSHCQVLLRGSLLACSNPILVVPARSTGVSSQAWVGSVGRLAGAASPTRLVTRQTARAEGTSQGRRDRARHAGRARRRQGSLDGQPPCGRVSASLDGLVGVPGSIITATRGKGWQEGTRRRIENPS